MVKRIGTIGGRAQPGREEKTITKDGLVLAAIALVSIAFGVGLYEQVGLNIVLSATMAAGGFFILFSLHYIIVQLSSSESMSPRISSLERVVARLARDMSQVEDISKEIAEFRNTCERIDQAHSQLELGGFGESIQQREETTQRLNQDIRRLDAQIRSLRDYFELTNQENKEKLKTELLTIENHVKHVSDSFRIQAPDRSQPLMLGLPPAPPILPSAQQLGSPLGSPVFPSQNNSQQMETLMPEFSAQPASQHQVQSQQQPQSQQQLQSQQPDLPQNLTPNFFENYQSSEVEFTPLPSFTPPPPDNSMQNSLPQSQHEFQFTPQPLEQHANTEQNSFMQQPLQSTPSVMQEQAMSTSLQPQIAVQAMQEQSPLQLPMQQIQQPQPPLAMQSQPMQSHTMQPQGMQSQGGQGQNIQPQSQQNQAQPQLQQQAQPAQAMLQTHQQQQASNDLIFQDSQEIEPDQNILDTIKKAISGNRIDLYLQPIVSLPERSVIFYESLTRLRDEDEKLILPSQYMKVAESNGIMPVIDNVMLFRTIQVARKLIERGTARGLFCNLSASSIMDNEFFGEFLGFMDRNKDLSKGMFFDIEQAAYGQPGRAELEKLNALAKLGYRFSLDNVTNLNLDFPQLQRQGVRFIKIDAKRLLHNIEQTGVRIHIADLRSYLKRYDIELVASKIEDESALTQLQNYNIKLGQGFLFSEPRPVRPEIFKKGSSQQAA